MNTPDASLNLSAAAAILQESVAAGASREELIRRMREMGLNQIECIKVFRDLMRVSLGQAKIAVHSSQAWANCRESNDALHEAAFSAAEELGYVEGSAGVS